MVRVRLGDGSLRRVDVDEREVTSQNELRNFLLKEGIITSSSPVKLKVKDSILVNGAATENERKNMFIWKPGEIIEVIEVSSVPLHSLHSYVCAFLKRLLNTIVHALQFNSYAGGNNEK